MVRLLGLSGSLRRVSNSTAVLRGLQDALATRAALDIFPLHGSARHVLRPQIVIGGAYEKVRDGRLVDEATLRFALAGVDDLLDDIRAARFLRAVSFLILFVPSRTSAEKACNGSTRPMFGWGDTYR